MACVHRCCRGRETDTDGQAFEVGDSCEKLVGRVCEMENEGDQREDPLSLCTSIGNVVFLLVFALLPKLSQFHGSLSRIRWSGGIERSERNGRGAGTEIGSPTNLSESS